MRNDLDPVTIIQTRYGGIYEGGEWAAFPVDAGRVPEDVIGDDVACATWWADHGRSVGVAATPDAALADLEAKVAAGQHLRAAS